MNYKVVMYICININNMTTSIQEIEPKKPVFTPQLSRRMIVCATIGLVLISFFVISAGKGNPSWGEFWQVKPLLLTPFMCAMVGLCYDITEPLRKLTGWRGSVLFVLSILGLIVGFWMSLILGLNGTMWN